MKPIGYVKRLESGPISWDQPEIAEIHLEPHFALGLTGLKDYSHLQVIFQFHERNEENLPLTVRPEGRSDMPEVGVFATCSPCRPNPIGLTCVEIVNITNHILTVKGLDCHDKTPILDLKPFSDAPENPRIPGWLEILWKE